MTVLLSRMDDESLAEDPTYRAGVLMGRQQSVTDVMDLLLNPGGESADDRLMAVMKWCIQSLEEGKAEVHLIVDALRDESD